MPRRYFSSKRRRISRPRRLRVLKYKSTPFIRAARANQGVTSGPRVRKAARMGLFYDMMKKYMATAYVGKPSIASKTFSLALRNKNTALANKQMKLEGFRVSRFCLMSYAGSGTYAAVPSFTDSNYNLAGLAPPMVIQMRLFPSQGVAFPSTFNLYSQQWLPLTYAEIPVVTIQPQWPGSRLNSFSSPAQGTTNQPYWGLLVGNQTINNRNYNYNTRAVQNVISFLTNSAMNTDNLEILYRSIKVYKSTLTFEFFNTDPYKEMDVHIVHFKYVDFDTSTLESGCIPSTQDNQLLNNLVSGEAGTTTVSFFEQNIASNAFEYCLAHKKLPSKNYVTKSWRTITLGRCKDTVFAPVATNNVTPENYGAPISRKPYRKMTFKYGPKTWTRQGCTAEGSFISDEVMQDRQKIDTQVMVFCTLNKNYMVDNAVHTDPTSAAYPATYGVVNYRFWKTNIWKEQS